MEPWERDFKVETSNIKAISEYAKLSFNEVLELPYPLFLLYRKDAWIYNEGQSEKGREFLKTLWRLQQTKADIKAIRKFQQRGGNS